MFGTKDNHLAIELANIKVEKEALQKKYDSIHEEYNKKQAQFIRETELAHKERMMELERNYTNEISKLKSDHKLEMLSVKEKAMEEYMEKLSKANEANYEKLSNSLAKLHEEGNANTKTIKEFALKAMETSRPVIQRQLK